MASSLYPPAIYSLRDDVIGGVVDRVAPHNSKMELRFLVDPALPHQLSSRSVTEMSSSNQKQFPPLMAMASENTTDLSFKPPKVFEHKLKRISASRREQCRINQARYRSRQRAREKFVISSIRQLKVDIRDLETRRQTIASRSRFPKSIWSVAIEYFRLFQHGYIAPPLVPSADHQPSVMAEERPHKPHAQIDFLRDTMVHDVTDGIIHGVEALLENWKLLSLYHDDVFVQLQRLDYVTEDSLQATTTVGLTITENTLQHLYLHLLVSPIRDHKEEQVSPLAAKLLNQRIVVRGTVRFDWDEASCCMTRLETKLDLLSPFLELLGSLEDTARVFDTALLTPEGRRFYLSLFRVLSLSLSVSGLVDPASLASRRRDLRLATYLGRLHGVQPCLIRKGFNKRQTRGSDEAAIVVDTTVQWRDALYDDSNDLVAYQVATKYTLFPVEVVRLRAVISDYALDTIRKQGFSLILQQQTPKYDYFSRLWLSSLWNALPVTRT
ncbi:hypothetical protein PC122_g19484 [Phytophthora cactorum]|nr:hypothetical protein PC122_g19484 [Phytophthora cactorum]